MVIKRAPESKILRRNRSINKSRRLFTRALVSCYLYLPSMQKIYICIKACNIFQVCVCNIYIYIGIEHTRAFGTIYSVYVLVSFALVYTPKHVQLFFLRKKLFQHFFHYLFLLVTKYRRWNRKSDVEIVFSGQMPGFSHMSVYGARVSLEFIQMRGKDTKTLPHEEIQK